MPDIPATPPTPDNADDKRFNELMNDPDGISEAALQAELMKYRTALEEEFAESLENAKPENVEAELTAFFRKQAAVSAAQIVWLSLNAESESVKFNANKYVLAMAIEEANAAGDPIADILKGINANTISESDVAANVAANANIPTITTAPAPQAMPPESPNININKTAKQIMNDLKTKGQADDSN